MAVAKGHPRHQQSRFPMCPFFRKSTYAANAGFFDPSENIILPPEFTTGCVGAENRAGNACAKKRALFERCF